MSFKAGESGSMGSVDEALLGAAFSGQLALVKTLVPKPSRVPTRKGRQHAMEATLSRNKDVPVQMDVLRYFVEDLKQRPTEDMLCNAAARGDAELFFYLSKKNPSLLDEYAVFLNHAAYGGNVEIMEFLLETPIHSDDLMQVIESSLTCCQTNDTLDLLLDQLLKQDPEKREEVIEEFLLTSRRKDLRAVKIFVSYMKKHEVENLLKVTEAGKVKDYLLKLLARWVE